MLNKMEVSNLPEIEFKKMIIRMLKKHSENFNKEIVSIKKDIETTEKNQAEIKNMRSVQKVFSHVI